MFEKRLDFEHSCSPRQAGRGSKNQLAHSFCDSLIRGNDETFELAPMARGGHARAGRMSKNGTSLSIPAPSSAGSGAVIDYW
jgi:hypothetical protein